MSDHVLAEIARLTGAIAEHKSGTSTSHSPSTYAPRGRGSSRGRGRGSYSATPFHRNSTWVAPGRPSSSNNSRSGTSTPNPLLDSATAAASAPTPDVVVPVPPGGFRNRTLVLNGPAGASSTSAPSTPKPAPPPPPPKEAVEVVIGGATFVADPRGNKLVRKTGPSTTATPSAPTDESSSTPKRTSVSGTTYIRTKSGNLVSLDFARQRKEINERKAWAMKKDRLDRLVGIAKKGQGVRDAAKAGRGRGRGRGRGGSFASRSAPKKSTKLCRFFQKTGQCTRGLTCPYIHDSHKVSLCPLFLRSKCPLKSSTCLLSHTPSPHRSPHCLHFPHCTRPSCPYAHITVDRDAPVCRAFVEYGWCEKGEECRMRHSVECPEFSERGTCGKVGCKLPHVLRRRNGEGEEEEVEEESDEGGEELGEGEIEWEARRPSKRAREGRGESSDGEEEQGGLWGGGISGAAGRQLSKKARRAAHDLDQNSDFVTLSIPLDDDQDDDDDDDSDGESVDSADLVEDDNSSSEDGEDEEEAQLDVAVASGSATTNAKVNTDAYADESDEDGDEEVEKLLRF